MIETLEVLWQRGSRIGLREDEGVHDKREVIFANRLLLIIPVILLFYLPFELALNGTDAIHLVLLFMAVLLAPLLFNRWRWFAFSRYFSYIAAILFTTLAGLAVGKGINNHVVLVTLPLLGIILFRTLPERILALFMVIAAYLAFQAMQSLVTPVFLIPESVKPTFSSVFFVIAIVLNFLVGFYFVGLNSEYERIVVRQREELAGKNKEITDSITYAKRIQASILPDEEVLSAMLPRHFVLYLPKDIVAGDFYWAQQKGNVVLFAVADCTGHGVPGALVSVVCHNALNRCVNEFGLSEPAAILTKARELVMREFGGKSELIRDGMDISLCRLDGNTLELQWAGANNPLLILNDQGLSIMKPDKQPVAADERMAPFTNHLRKLVKGDMLYLYSDGFGDQFGGPEGKKFRQVTLRNLLQQMYGLPLQQQREKLLDVLQTWRGSLEQVDDVCVIGVQV